MNCQFSERWIKTEVHCMEEKGMFTKKGEKFFAHLNPHLSHSHKKRFCQKLKTQNEKNSLLLITYEREIIKIYLWLGYDDVSWFSIKIYFNLERALVKRKKTADCRRIEMDGKSFNLGHVIMQCKSRIFHQIEMEAIFFKFSEILLGEIVHLKFSLFYARGR